MSIDREVNSVANAYMGNEAALQNKYAMEQQLIDLLALQKLKSDREAAAKEMQMKAQVPPATVAGQLENENLQAIKQQIVGDMPQEGILAAAQGGMVRGFAEGGGVDLDAAKQTLPFDETVDVDLDKAIQASPFDETVDVDLDAAKQTLPFDETVDADPDGVEKLLDSSYEEGTVKNPDTGEELIKIGGAIAGWAMDNPVDAIGMGLMFIPGIGWGVAGGIKGLGLAYRGLKGIDYLSKGKNIGQGIVKGSKGLGNLIQKGFTKPATRNTKTGQFMKARRDFSLGRTAVVGGPLTGGALMKISDLYENGFSDEDIEEAIASGQLTQQSGTGATGTGDTGTGATGTGSTTEPPMSAYDKIMEKYDANYKDQIANLNKEDTIKRKEDRLARLAEINKPEEKEAIDVILAAMRGRGTYGAGGASYALEQDELARRKRSKEYQTMLVENEDQIDTLTQTLGDQEMAIRLTTATSEYARDIARQALLLDTKEKRDKLVTDALIKIAQQQIDILKTNPNYIAAQNAGDSTEMKEIESAARTAVNSLEEIKILRNLVGLKESDTLSGSPSSVVSADTDRKYMQS